MKNSAIEPSAVKISGNRQNNGASLIFAAAPPSPSGGLA